MGEAVRVDTVEVFKEFKIALIKFQEAATVALGDAESEMHRVLTWLQHEQDSYWQHQIRKREEIVGRCKEAVRMKKVFKDATGRQQTAIEEEKALKTAQRNLEEAQQKLAMVRKWARALPKEIEMYKGGVQRFATSVQSDIPVAMSHLEKLAQKIEAYAAVQIAEMGAAVGGESAGPAEPSMGRGSVGLPSFPVEELTKLIAEVPTPEVRAAAPLVELTKLSVPTIPPDHHAPAMLPVTARLAPPEGTRVFVARGLGNAPRLFLHHHPERFSEVDSGWSIAPGQPTEGLEWDAISAAELLKSRPDLADLLGLPRGFSVMIDSSGISDVIDGHRQPAWRRA